MKRITTILGLVLISSSVFASTPLKMEGYSCGLEVGKALGTLANTKAAQDIKNLSEDITDYVGRSELASTIKNKREKQQILQAANNAWQSINYSMDKIKAVSPETATNIDRECGLSPE